MKIVSLWCCILALHAGSDAQTTASPGQATVYYGGKILTMDGDTPSYTEAVVVQEGRIGYVGAKDDAMRAAGKNPPTVDLAGETLMSG